MTFLNGGKHGKLRHKIYKKEDTMARICSDAYSITYVYASPRSPIAGEHPGDYTPAEWVEIGAANYKVESIVWKNMDDTDVTTFEAGKIYTGTVTFKADTGFAFDGDRINSDRIFNSSNAEVVGSYTLADGGATLTATFKLKDENVVRPGLNVKVKLPTLNDKIGQSLPAAELVGTNLPENVELVYSVFKDNLLGEEITDPNYKVKSNQKYLYVVWLKVGDSTDITEITKMYNVFYEVTDGGDAETYTDFVGYGVLAMYQTPDTSKINSVALTVTAPKYGEAPATTATGANDTLYTVGTPTWTPAEMDGKFGANTYTVSIPVTAASGYSFDENGIYTINGYVATYADGKVSYTFPQLTAPHTHDTDAQPWVYMDPGTHIKTCTAGDDFKVEAHDFSAWTKVDDTNHSRTCTKCKKSGEAINYTETAEHTWEWVVDQEAELNQPGKKHEECTGCHAKRNKNTEIPALRDYAVTVTGGTATVAAGTTITRAMEGVEVTVKADAPETGKVFDKWVVKAGGVTLANETSATTTFTMPGNDVKLKATYKDAPSSHTHSYGTEWKYDGTNHWHECACGDKADIAAHSASEWIVDTAATETADGTKHKECTVCKKVLETATIPATGSTHTHSYGTEWKYDETNHWHECACGDKADIAAHSASEWIVDTAATETADGTKHKECTVCKKVLETATIPATGSTHTHSYGTEWKYDETNHWHECACGDKADIAAHSASEWIVDTAATETADGTKHKECTVCKKVLETATIPATGSTHTHSYGTEWKYDSTNHWHKCECGDKADTAAHSFQWVIDKAATKDATGIKHEECTVCGAKRSENTVIDKLHDGGNTGNTSSGDNNTNKPGKDDSTKSSKTGDSNNLIGWLAVLFVSGGVLTVLGLNGKKRKESEAE